MTAKAEEDLMAWLRNAHAMEEQAVTMLEALAGRTGDYPEVKTRFQRHLGETQRQAEALGNASNAAAATRLP